MHIFSFFFCALVSNQCTQSVLLAEVLNYFCMIFYSSGSVNLTRPACVQRTFSNYLLPAVGQFSCSYALLNTPSDDFYLKFIEVSEGAVLYFHGGKQYRI